MKQLDLFSWAKRNHRQKQRESRKKKTGPCEWKIVAVRECATDTTTPIIDKPQLAVDYWHSHVVTAPHFNPDVECFVVILLNTRLRVRGHNVVSIGSLNESLAHPREVFRAAVIGAAYGILLMHNHPSGDPTPSEADMRTTRRLVESGTVLQIEVKDHIIVGHERYYSFREAGLI